MEPGTRIAHYDILDLIGTGGMGAVYRATDTKLSRDVALKVLPLTFAEDADRLARFQREAQALAALQHPNIASIYGIERDQEQTFLVMELCEGQDLSEIIDQGAISVEEARSIAGQVASGLEEAHEKGVIHRDLKPANIKVSSEGKVKLLDFGLARTFDDDNSSTEVSADTMTAAIAITQPGVVLGTAAYMSPEQARGKTIDKRTDIWAFGVILYEMLAGKRLFTGETVSDVLASVLRQEVKLDDLPPNLPAEMTYLIRRSLDRNKESRLRDIGEARCLFNEDASASSLSLLADTNFEFDSQSPRATRYIWPVVAVLAVCALLYTTFGPNSADDSPAHQPVGFTQLTAQGQSEHHGAMGPDGNFFVFAAKNGDNNDIFMQRTAGSNPINLTNRVTSNDYQPALSADGQKIVFTSNREGGGIYIMGATGESARLLARGGSNPAWSPDGKQVAYSTIDFRDPSSLSGDSEIWMVSADGGPTQKVPLDIDGLQPAWSPNGKRIAFWTVINESGQRDLWTVRPDGTELTQVTNDEPLDYCPVWSADGHWLYFLSNRDGLVNLWRIPVDQDSGLAKGDAERVTVPSPNVTHFALSPDGSRIIYSSTRDQRHVYQATLDPNTLQLTSRPQAIVKGSMIIEGAQYADDGDWLVLFRRGLNEDLYIVRNDGTGLQQVTDDVYRDRGASWYDNDQKLIFYSDRGGKYDIWSIRPDGADLTQLSDQPISYWYPIAHPAVDFVLGKDQNGTVKLPWNEDRTALGDPEPFAVTDQAGDVFYHSGWSPDGRKVSGWLNNTAEFADGRISIYDVEENAFSYIFARELTLNAHTWGPRGESVIGVGVEGVQAIIFEDNKLQTILPNADLPGVRGIDFDAETNTLVFLVQKLESDLWLVELAP